MTTFDWCLTNDHDNCKRSFQKFVFVPQRKRGLPPTRIDWLDETVYCVCIKRGCECYTKPADRPKTKRRKRKA